MLRITKMLIAVAAVALLASPAMAADVTANVTVLEYSEINFPDGTQIELEVPDNATFYGPSGQTPGLVEYGGQLWMSVNANYIAKVTFEGAEDMTDKDGNHYAKVTHGTSDVLGVLPAIGMGYREPGVGGVSCEWGDWSIANAPATIPGTVFTDPLPLGLNELTLFISSKMDQTPDGSLAPAGTYTGTLVVMVTVAP
ncbi:MAG: hypothetical protein WBD05_06855 [Phycisphaerae bacterium]